MTGPVYVPVSDEVMRTGRLECYLPKPVSDLEFRYPDCPVCDDGGSMVYDDSWYCENCSHNWDKDGRHGEYIGETCDPEALG